MNEFVGPGQQPTGNLRPAQPASPRSGKHEDELVQPASPRPRPAQPASPADRPKRVRVCVVWDARIASSVARELGQAERDEFRRLVNRGRNVRDCTLSAGDGFVVYSPGLPQIAVRKYADEIYMLLGRAPRWVDGDPPLVPASPARPDTPVRVRIVWDASATRPLWQAERDLFRALVSPDPRARKVPDVQHMNFTLSAGHGFVADGPDLPHIAVGKIADAINVLLVPAPPDLPDLFRLRPYHPMGPFPRVPPKPPPPVNNPFDLGI